MKSLDNLRKLARRWLNALRAQDPDAVARLRRAHPTAPASPGLRDVQHAIARERGHESWIALAQALAAGPTAPPDLERYEARARDLVSAYETGAAAALERISQFSGRPALSWADLRAAVDQRFKSWNIPEPFGLETSRFLVARQAGFDTWADLVTALSAATRPAAAQQVTPIRDSSPGPDDVPVEMRTAFPVRLQDGVMSMTTTVWDVLMSARDGRLDHLEELIAPARRSSSATTTTCRRCTSPSARDTWRSSASSPTAARSTRSTRPIRTRRPIVTVAEDRGYTARSPRLLRRYGSQPSIRIVRDEDGGDIDYGKDPKAGIGSSSS